MRAQELWRRSAALSRVSVCLKWPHLRLTLSSNHDFMPLQHLHLHLISIPTLFGKRPFHPIRKFSATLKTFAVFYRRRSLLLRRRYSTLIWPIPRNHCLPTQTMAIAFEETQTLSSSPIEWLCKMPRHRWHYYNS